jgi:hypothetical protein
MDLLFDSKVTYINTKYGMWLQTSWDATGRYSPVLGYSPVSSCGLLKSYTFVKYLTRRVVSSYQEQDQPINQVLITLRVFAKLALAYSPSLSTVLLKSVMFTPVLFSPSRDRGNTDFLGLAVVALSSTIDTRGSFSPVILPCESVRGPGVSNLLARFIFSPLFEK